VKGGTNVGFNEASGRMGVIFFAISEQFQEGTFVISHVLAPYTIIGLSQRSEEGRFF
jgi:hypothetical protein